MKYLKVDPDTFIEYDPDTKRVRMVSRTELQAEINSSKAQLAALPKPLTNAELLAWAKANYAEGNYEESRKLLVRKIAILEAELAEIVLVG